MAGDVSRFGGVILWTEATRFQEVRRFYVDVLGLRPRSDRDGLVNFEWGDVRLTVSVHDRVHGPAADPLRVMVNFVVDDLEAAHRRMTAAGVPCLRVPEPEHWGGRVATYTDPDGNVVQLLEMPGRQPAGSPPCPPT
ncbi:MAG: VOC family protein [Acidimicrobiia bacterium]